MTTISFEPTIPMTAFIGLCLLTALLLFLPFIQKRRRLTASAVLRTASACFILLALSNPVKVYRFDAATKPLLIVMIDNSESMAVKDAGTMSRLQYAQTALNEKISRLWSTTYNVKFVSFDLEAKETALSEMKADGKSTRLGECLRQTLTRYSAERPAGIVMISDGRNFGDMDPITVAQRCKEAFIPIFAMPLGSNTGSKDISVVLPKKQYIAMPNQTATVNAELFSSGYQNKTVMTRLSKNGAVVSEKKTLISYNKPSQVHFTISENAVGLNHYTVSVDAIPGETDKANNQSSFIIQCARTPIKTLMLSAQPNWDTKFLVDALSKDPSIDLEVIYKLSPEDYYRLHGKALTAQASTPSTRIPHEISDFSQYSVVILGNGLGDLLTAKALTALKKYVSDYRGSIIILAPSSIAENSIIAEISPLNCAVADDKSVRLILTNEGNNHPAFSFSTAENSQLMFNAMPELDIKAQSIVEKPLSTALAKAKIITSEADNTSTAIATWRYGLGNVTAVLCEGWWRWSFLPPEMSRYDKVYNEFWVQLIQWSAFQSDAMPGQALLLRTDKTNYLINEPVKLFAEGSKVKASEIIATVKHANGNKSNIALTKSTTEHAKYVGEFIPKQTGDYVAYLPGDSSNTFIPYTQFSATESTQEQINTNADYTILKRISSASGGKLINAKNLEDLPKQISVARAGILPKNRRLTLWDNGWVLALALFIIMIEWIIRQRQETL